MEINLTKEQYKALIEMVYLGEWMINATRDNPIKKYNDLEQHIFSFAKKGELQEIIEFDEEMKMYFPTREFEEGQLDEYKDEYDDETFWDELIARLTDRDLERQYGKKLSNACPGRNNLRRGNPFETNTKKNFPKMGSRILRS